MPLSGTPKEFFLDTLEHHRCPLGALLITSRDVDAGEVDPHREDAGEPADRVQGRPHRAPRELRGPWALHRDEYVVGSYALCLPPLRSAVPASAVSCLSAESSNETVVD